MAAVARVPRADFLMVVELVRSSGMLTIVEKRQVRARLGSTRGDAGDKD